MQLVFSRLVKLSFLIILFIIFSMACNSDPSSLESFVNPTPLSEGIPTMKINTPSAPLIGQYTYHRHYPGGGSETGALKISGFGPGFRLDWSGPKRKENGIALLNANLLAVATGHKCALALYHSYQNKGLSGAWMGWGGAPGRETVWSNKGLDQKDYSGEYQVDGENGDGSRYHGILNIGKQDAHYAFKWNVGGETFSGVGLAHDQQLASAYGASDCKVAVYTVKPDGTLDGLFAAADSDQPGSEAIRRD
jgi:hypothetical protein